MSNLFQVGKAYTRKDIQDILGVPSEKRGGNWFTGYHKYNDEWFVFCNVGTSGRTGHNYNDTFEGSDLIWSGKTNSHKGQPSIKSMINPNTNVFIFVRKQDRAPFIYLGNGVAYQVFDEVPVRIHWKFSK